MTFPAYVIGLLINEDFGPYRDDFAPPGDAKMRSLGEKMPISKRERLVQLFPWLEPGAGIREWYPGPFRGAEGMTRVSLLASGNVGIPRPTKAGERITVCSATGQIFYTDRYAILYAGDRGIEKVKGGTLAYDIVMHQDGYPGSPTLESYVCAPIMWRLVEEIERIEGSSWCGKYWCDLRETVPQVMNDVVLSDLDGDDITRLAVTVISEIEAAHRRLINT